MMNKTRQINLEQWLYLLMFVLALGLRVLNLGDAPLSDFEARWAIPSWNAVQGNPVFPGSSPGYFSLTTIIFYFFAGNNLLARFWPALVGSLVVLAPFGFRRLLGRSAALLMSFGLAFDPGMVALSRLAGGPMMAIGFGMLGLALIYNRKMVWAGIICGLALISGPSVLTGLVGMILTFVVARWSGLTKLLMKSPDTEPIQEPSQTSNQKNRSGLLVAGMVVLLASTLFFRYPRALGGLGNSFSDYFLGWKSPSGIPALRPILALIMYQPLGVVLAVISAVRGWVEGNKTSRWLSLWMLLAIFLSLLYPGRQVYDVAWAILPIWALAGIEFSRYLYPVIPIMAGIGQAGVVFVLCLLFYLVSLNFIPGTLTWLILVIVPILITLTTVLAGLGWSWDAARSGVVWGLSVSASFYVLAAMFGTSQLRPNSPRELWTPPPGPAQAELLESTISDLGVIQNGRRDWIDIVSLVNSPSLEWVLRNFSDVRYVSTLDPNYLPSVIITPDTAAEGSDLSQKMAYRGQDFSWAIYPDWSGGLPPQWWTWVTSRQVPTSNVNIVLWARSDFFPEQSDQTQDDTNGTSLEVEDFLPSDGSIK